MTQKQREQHEAVEHIRKLAPIGSTVYTVLRRVSASGMMRHIDVYVIADNRPVYLSGWVAAALDQRRTEQGQIKVSGAGMDMGFHLVSNLAYVVWHDTPEHTAWSESVDFPAWQSRSAEYTYKHEWL